MITFNEAQLVAWLSPVLWPFLRVLAVFSVAPIFSMRMIPMRVKIGLAFLVALCAQGILVNQPIVDINGRDAIGAVVQQVVIGLSIGFAVRLVFSSVELAGEIIGLQMGLNFASFFDPASNAQISAVARFFGNVSMLLFIVVNGHLMVVMAVGALLLLLALLSGARRTACGARPWISVYSSAERSSTPSASASRVKVEARHPCGRRRNTKRSPGCQTRSKRPRC